MKTNSWQASDDEQPQGRQKAYAGTRMLYTLRTGEERD